MAVRLWRTAIATALLLAASRESLAQARAWTIVPSVGVRGTYTDNASLVAAPEQGEFVTDLSPGISILGRGRRFRANLNYTADLLFYARDRENDRLANRLAGSANLEAIEDLFFVDAQANVDQTYLSPFAPRPTEIATATDNRLESRTFTLSPYLRTQIAGGYAVEVRNSNTWTTTDTGSLPKVHTRQWSGSLASPIRLFGWAVDGSKSDIAYDDPVTNRPERESAIARGRLFFQPNGTLRLSASAGRESNNFIFDETRSSKTYGYGLLWRPTPRTSLQFDWERRFFGVSRTASFDHRTPLSAWNITYSKDVSSFQQQVAVPALVSVPALLDQVLRSRIPDPVQRQQFIEQFLRTSGTPAVLGVPLAFFTEQVFIQERLQASFAILGARNSIVFTGTTARSTSITEAPPDVPAETFLAFGRRIKQRGLGASASHRLSGLTSLAIGANTLFSEAEDTGLDSRTDYYSLNLTRRVSPKTDAFAGASYTHFVSEDTSRNARSIFAGLLHRF